MPVPSLDFQALTRVVSAPGAIDRLGEFARDFGARRVLVVSDPGVVAAGHTERGLRSLRAVGLETELFDRVEENPTTRHVRDGVEFAADRDVDFIVGLGGGSAMDCAKGVNFVLSCGGEMADYQGVGKATGPLLPMIAVPTTAGTGSEAQSFALIANERTHMKMACGDKRAACKVALLDPETTVSQPVAVTAATGIDAVAHAVETFVTRPRNVISRAFSRQAWQLLEANFERVLERPDDLDARGAMQLGACLAGCAIESSMLGAAHSLANPLTARYGVVHGGAVGLFLPHVVRFNAAVVGDDYGELARCTVRGLADATVEGLASRLEALLAASRLPGTLAAWSVDPVDLPEMAAEASAQWTARFNPRNVEAEDLLQIYRAAM